MDHAFAEEQIGFDHAPVMDIRDKILASRLARDQSFEVVPEIWTVG